MMQRGFEGQHREEARGAIPPAALLKLQIDLMLASSILFTTEEEEVIAKQGSGQILSGPERLRFAAAVDSWWKGIQSEDHADLTSYLKERFKEQHASEHGTWFSDEELLSAVLKGEAGLGSEVRARYEKEHADDIEGLTALCELGTFFDDERELDAVHESGTHGKDKREKVYELLERLTEYQFLLTHYVIARSDLPIEYLANFWKGCAAVAERLGKGEDFARRKRGILSQVATYKILRLLGHHPSLSHPEEDAREAVDIRDESGIYQVKTASKLFIGKIDAEGHISYPGVQGRSPGGKTTYLDTRMQGKRSFQETVASYRSRHPDLEPFEAFYIAIPPDMIDEVNGDPDESVVTQVRLFLASS